MKFASPVTFVQCYVSTN